MNSSEKRFSISAVRCSGELVLRYTILLFGLAFIGLLVYILSELTISTILSVAGVVLYISIITLISWQFLYWRAFGNCIRVSPSQYPEIYNVSNQVRLKLGLERMPQIFIMQGHGLVEALVAKRFTRKGIIIITSNLLDDLSETGNTRALMMLIGRQMGHIAAGHFKLWFLIDVISILPLITIFLNTAYWRRCHITADRIGYMVCGQLSDAEQSLLIITVGKRFAPNTNLDAVREQSDEIVGWWAWVYEIISSYPYMVDRIIALREFHIKVQHGEIKDLYGKPIQNLSINHTYYAPVQVGIQMIGDGNSASQIAPPST